MPLDTPHDPETGELLDAPARPPAREPTPMPDFDGMTERQLLVHIAKQNHDIADSQLSLLDIADALTGTTEELLRETRGEGEKKDGKSLNDSVDELTAALERMAEEMRTGRREIPKDTADRVRGAVATILGEVLDAADGKAPTEGAEARPAA